VTDTWATTATLRCEQSVSVICCDSQ